VSLWCQSWIGVGRNDPCWCGRGRKYKQCHMPIDESDVPQNIRQAEHSLCAGSSGHPYLHKYMSADLIEPRGEPAIDPLKEILLEDRLYFPLPSQLNDPFECRVNSDLEGTFEEKRRFYFTKVKVQFGFGDARACRITDEWLETGKHEGVEFWQNEETELIRLARTSQFRVLCLTPHADNLLMWSHYGNAHRGVCLRFENRDAIAGAVAVRYSSDYPLVSFFSSSRFEQMRAFVLTKSDHWSYEEEFRFLSISGSDVGPTTHKTFDPTLLSGIVLGCEMDCETRERVLDLAGRRQHSLEIIEAKRSERRFAVEVDERI
jgi:hypothetical protein